VLSQSDEENIIEYYEERAAMLEHEARICRSDAEDYALDATIRKFGLTAQDAHRILGHGQA
jgi:hypothetical protein